MPSIKRISSKPPDEQNALLQQLGLPHIQSFNYMVDEGLDKAVSNLDPVQFELKTGEKVTLRIIDANLNYPAAPHDTVGVRTTKIYPTECRQRAATYRGRFVVRVSWAVDGREQVFDKDMGEIPIMLKSNRCHLNMMSPAELVKHGEHEQEWGGYFVVKGHERLVRMLLMTRRNYPIAIKRSSWKMRGSLFSEHGVSIRSVSDDQTATTNVLHFVTDGSAKFMFSHQKILYYTPLILILKSLCDYCDYYIYERLIEGFEDDSYYADCIQNMMREIHKEGLHTHTDCKTYMGKMFRVKFTECPPWSSDLDVADFIINKCILIHLDNSHDKFNMLVFMAQKLYVFVQDKCKIEGADAVMMQECLLGGHLYLQVIKDKLHIWLLSLKNNLIKRANTTTFTTLSHAEVMKAAKHSGGLEALMQLFLATGNVSSTSGLGLMQDKGLTIVAENINRMRYMSHFKSVHRGAFFQEMRTTEARQLLPDAWGFICPVHTPDGTPCGLLNHLTMNCTITETPSNRKIENIPLILIELGMIPLSDRIQHINDKKYIVQLDGKLIGLIRIEDAVILVNRLRLDKIKGDLIPNTLEIVLIPRKNVLSQYPGLYLFTGPARMMRPLINLSTKQIEFIGTFEQVYLDICVTTNEYYPDVTTHMELSPRSFLSNLAQLIPMPDYNQSPRNMYQCQMGKQTMGTPCHNWNLQAETKLYRLQTPGTPLFQPEHQDEILLNEFPMGTNAIVAVISYTGYDMEDAMIINKGAEERGLAHGSIYKSEFIEIDFPSYFCRDPTNASLSEYLDTDGLPFAGRRVAIGQPLCCFYNVDESHYVVKKFGGKEDCVVDSVKLCGDFNSRANRLACVVFRVQRNPSVGDKFASRAGQKGICSQKWPAEDLPFTETGLVPDIIFNPHGFPSRMTIAMMIEIMAGKSGALHGLYHDATPFTFTENDTAIDYFGRLLEAAGYNYYGSETMYSGIDGREMNVQIFLGVVYYQRLRHMVSDKWQVRSTGPIDITTRQPLKGRKRGGGVRFGEMERDSLISHGTNFLTQDRLLNCSDVSTCFICTACESLVGPVTVVTRVADKSHLSTSSEVCRLCGESSNIAQISLPYILKYLIIQLVSCNIIVKVNCADT